MPKLFYFRINEAKSHQLERCRAVYVSKAGVHAGTLGLFFFWCILWGSFSHD